MAALGQAQILWSKLEKGLKFSQQESLSSSINLEEY